MLVSCLFKLSLSASSVSRSLKYFVLFFENFVTNFPLEYGIPTIRTQHSAEGHIEESKYSKNNSNERTNLMNVQLDLHPNFASYFPTPTPVEQLEHPQGFSSSFPLPKRSHRLSCEYPRQSNRLNP